MQVTLNPEDQRYIEEQVRAGRYGSVEDFLAAAVARVRQTDRVGDFEPGELDTLIAQAEEEFARGEAHSMEEVRAHFSKRVGR